jgi:hypothetical protein
MSQDTSPMWSTSNSSSATRKRRVKAVRAVLRKKMSRDMKQHWMGVLLSLSAWDFVKRNAGIPE